MKTSEFLKIVKRDYLAKSSKEYTKGYKDKYLCCAIMKANGEADGFYIGPLIIRIERALGRYNTVEHWLIGHGCASFAAVHDENAIYEYRHRWIDSLIEEYETKGD